VAALKREVADRDATIGDKEKRIHDLKRKNQELEKFKFVLDYKIKELKRQIEPREAELVHLKSQIQARARCRRPAAVLPPCCLTLMMWEPYVPCAMSHMCHMCLLEYRGSRAGAQSMLCRPLSKMLMSAVRI